MELESYFNFINEDAIWIKGTRVGIEHVIDYYNEGETPEEIALHLRTLTLEQIYATITYYLANREKIDVYTKRINDEFDKAYEEQQRNPSEFIISLRRRLEEHRKKLYGNLESASSTK